MKLQKHNNTRLFKINKDLNLKKTALKRSFFMETKKGKGVIKMKKYLSMGVFALAATAIALPAMAGACDGNYCEDDSDSRLKIENNNRAHVTNNVKSKSNTGYNLANRNGGIGRIDTGNAYSDAMAQTEANTNNTEVECSDCVENAEEIKLKNNNRASASNRVESKANTGKNQANANKGKTVTEETVQPDPCEPPVSVKKTSNRGSGEIKTGKADSYATAISMLNSNVTRIK